MLTFFLSLKPQKPVVLRFAKFFHPLISPRPHAYNPSAPTTGVFRETFAGKRESALPSKP
jgi:hypothetical protein